MHLDREIGAKSGVLASHCLLVPNRARTASGASNRSGSASNRWSCILVSTMSLPVPRWSRVVHSTPSKPRGRARGSEQKRAGLQHEVSG